MFGPEYWALVGAWPFLVRRVSLAPGFPARPLATNSLLQSELVPGVPFDLCARIRSINAAERDIRVALAEGRAEDSIKLKARVGPADILLMVCDKAAFNEYLDPPRRTRLSRCGLRWGRLEVNNSEELVFNADPLYRGPWTPTQLWDANTAARRNIESSLAGILCLARRGLPGELAWCVIVLAFWSD